MISAVIVDDEADFIRLLVDSIIQASIPVKIMAACGNAAEAFNAIRKHKPELVFLDIEMPGKSGLELANDFPERDFEIIFTTSHEHYALKAIKAAAFDYLLKPVNVVELSAAVDKIERKIIEKRSKVPVPMNTGPAKMAVSSQDGILFLEIGTIIRCQADNVYTTIYTSDKKKIVSSKPIKDYEEHLIPYGFVRVHKSHLININHIKKYNKGEPGYLFMSDESVVPVSKTGKDELHAALKI